MGLKDYEVPDDRFELGDEIFAGFSFPCCCCRNVKGTDKDEPCVRCGHNTNAEKVP